MDSQRGSHPLQSYRRGYIVLAVLFLLTALLLAEIPLRTAHAAGVPDLLSNAPVVDENTVDTGACGRAAATMALDYYLLQQNQTAQPASISMVDQYVTESYGYDAKTGQIRPIGTRFDQIQTGLEAAGAQVGIPLKAALQTTDEAHWFVALTSELDANRPVIVFLPDGGALGWQWHYGHYIVVSGYTSDGSIIYHDPWDGKAHTISNAGFATAWGSSWQGNAPWWYMQITSPTSQTTATPNPAGTNTPPPGATNTPTSVPTDTPTPASFPTDTPVPPPPTDTPTPPSNSSGGLQVSPLNINPAVCQDVSGYYSCDIQLAAVGITDTISWSASTDLPGVIFNPPNGTLTPNGNNPSIVDVNIEVPQSDCFNGTVTFTGTGVTSVDLPWFCP